ncbi:MAG: hypothetical protein Q8L47_01765 [bacterium]|nr:hypothetical protein [bacterium]
MNTVTIKKDEYQRLKKVDKSFGQFLEYFEYAKNIAEAREEARSGKIISQEKLFKKLGL